MAGVRGLSVGCRWHRNGGELGRLGPELTGRAVDGPIYLKDGLEAAARGLVPIEGPVLKLAANYKKQGN